jgi:hypothetical protein
LVVMHTTGLKFILCRCDAFMQGYHKKLNTADHPLNR